MFSPYYMIKYMISALNTQIKANLITGVITCHVTFSTINTHIRIDERHYVLFVIQIIIFSDIWKSAPNYVCHSWDIFRRNNNLPRSRK